MTHQLPHSTATTEDVGPTMEPWSRQRSPKLLFIYSCAIAALTFAVDLISKQMALQILETNNRIPLIGDLFGLQLAFNTGAAFSIGSQITPFITLLGLVATVLLIRAALRTKHRIFAASIGLTLGGALGNIADRIFAPPGFGSGAVTDFLAYGNLFIGNIADIAIGLGVALYAFGIWRVHRVTQVRNAAERIENHTGESPTFDTVRSQAETTQP